MSVFLRRFIENKKYIVIAMVVVFLSGCTFGIYQYTLTTQGVKDFFQNLFYLNIDGYTNNYQLYVIQNGLYILICTYLSSSYLGHIGLLFLLFLKGIQLSFSFIYLLSLIQISFLVFLLIVIEIILEVILCLCMNLMCIYISIYVTQVTFFIEQNLNMKSMLNYKLNCFIISLIIFSLSLAFRIYIIPMF